MVEKRLRLVVSGRVQGVYYRANAQRKALYLGLRGWVRNLSDGGVEAVAEGPQEKLAEFMDYCRNNPGQAKVESLEFEWAEPKGEFYGFQIAPDA
ncbi:MAG: acylphosphatase [Candidatus Altiarchaeota archaeon]|nr:acylphosphatase [Candidatus Altiarchaeota archaeon]